MSTGEDYNELPPHYTDFAASLPSTFSVGDQQVSPLVKVSDIQPHLRLLAAFDKLKFDVINQVPSYNEVKKSQLDPFYTQPEGSSNRNNTEDELAKLESEKDRLWVTFVHRAVYRFDAFMRAPWAEMPRWSEASILPLDVIMVWHTYLLNPRRYYEDSIRRTTPFSRRLEAMETMPLSLIATLIDPETFTPLPPSPEREFFFESLSGLPYKYDLITTKDDKATLTCPCCDMVHNNVPWITGAEGGWKGFAEPNFAFSCHSCSREFTREMMGVRKFCEEVTRRRANRKVYFPEALLQPMIGRPDTMIADMFNQRLLRRIVAVFKLSPTCTADAISLESRQLAEGLDWKLDTLSVHLHLGLRPSESFKISDPPLPKIQRILSAYSTPGYASMDLVAAVLRQGGFVEKMRDLGWLEPDRFIQVTEQRPLLRAIARYHAFLDLMSADTKTFLVPTLDIDLAWHTHQLFGAAYRADTDRLLKRIPNHDDNVGPDTIQGGYDFTAAAWKARYGVPYSLCGCIPDGPPVDPNSKGKQEKFNLNQRDIGLLRIKLPFGRSKKPSSSQPQKSLSVDDLALLISMQLEDSDGSHPSDHNMYVEKTDKTSNQSIQPDFINRELETRKRIQDIKGTITISRPQTESQGQSQTQDESRIIAQDSNGRGQSRLPIMNSHRRSKSDAATKAEEADQWRRLQVERKEAKPDHKEAFTTRPHWDGFYHEYWGVSVMTPHGFYGAVKYDNAVGGCGSGCASCGRAPGACNGGCGAV